MKAFFLKHRKLVIVLVIAFLTGVVYWQVKDHEFLLFDDYGYIVANYYIQPGVTWENLVWAFTRGYVANWHPLTWVSHMIDFGLFEFDPAGHHLHNVLLHLLASIALFLVFERMTGGFWQSAFVAIVFALHPLHVESVAWVSERKDTLSALFWILIMGAYVGYSKRAGVGQYLLVLLLFALGLMAKPMLVTLPFVLLLLDYWPLRRVSLASSAESRKHLYHCILEKVPLFLLSFGSSIITFIVQREGGAVSTLEAFPLEVRLANAALSYWRYLGKTFWPADLAVFYPLEVPNPLLAITGAVLLVIATIILVRAKAFPYLAVGWLWYVGTLVPVIGIVQVGAQAMADRYMYIPIIGVSIAVAWFLEEVTRRVPQRALWLGGAGIGMVIAMGVLSYRQVGKWKSTETLFEHTISVTRNNWMAHYNLGAAYEQTTDLEKARYHYQRTVDLYPTIASAHYDLGKVLGMLGSHEEAVHHLLKAIELKPSLERAYLRAGVELVKLRRIPEALPYLEKAYEFNRYYGDPNHNVALTLVGINELDLALVYLRKAAAAHPDDTTIREDIDRIRELKKQRRK